MRVVFVFQRLCGDSLFIDRFLPKYQTFTTILRAIESTITDKMRVYDDKLHSAINIQTSMLQILALPVFVSTLSGSAAVNSSLKQLEEDS